MTLVKNNRRKAALFLVMLFLVFCFISYQQEAEAVAPVVIAVGAVAVVAAAFCVYALVTSGVTFANTGSAQQAGNALYSNLKNSIDQAVATGKLIYIASEGVYKYVVNVGDDLWHQIKGYVDLTYNVGENYAGSSDATSFTDSNGKQLSVVGSYVTGRNPASSVYAKIFVSGSSVTTEYHWVSNDSIQSSETRNLNPSKGAVTCYLDISTGTLNFKYSDGTNAMSISFGSQGLFKYSPGQTAIGIKGQTGIVDNPNYDWRYPDTGTKPIDIPLVGSPGVENSDISFTNSAGDQVGLNVDDNVLEGVVGKTAEDVIPAPGSLTGTEVNDYTGDLTNEGTTDYPGDTTTKDETQSSLKYLVFTKFPFCLPWDIYNGIKLLASNPVPPKWEIDLLAPLGTEWIGKGKIIIDMKDYETIGTVIRWTETVGFCYMLILATRKLIWS